jgi:hypothetical protein
VVATRDAGQSGRDVPTLRIDRSLGGSLRLYRQDPLRWVGEAGQMGSMVALQFGHIKPTFVLNDPDAARSMLITNGEAWKRPNPTIAPIRLAIGENLFTQSDREWSLLQPSLAPDFRKRSLEPQPGRRAGAASTRRHQLVGRAHRVSASRPMVVLLTAERASTIRIANPLSSPRWFSWGLRAAP